MADQNYGNAQQAVQVFYDPAAVQGVNLVPAVDSATTGRHASIVAGSNRYTVTSVAFTVTTTTFTGSGSLAYSIAKAATPTGPTITFDGFTSQFGPIEGEVTKDQGKVINLVCDVHSGE